MVSDSSPRSVAKQRAQRRIELAEAVKALAQARPPVALGFDDGDDPRRKADRRDGGARLRGELSLT